MPRGGRSPNHCAHVCGEVALDQVVMGRQPGALVSAASAAVRGEDPCLLPQPPHPSLRCDVAGGDELVGDEPVAGHGVVGVHVDHGVGQAGVSQIAVADWVLLPGVEGPAGEAQHPAVTATGTGKVSSAARSRTSANVILRAGRA